MSDLGQRAAQAVDGQALWQDLQALALVGARPDGGVDRPAFSRRGGQARLLVAGWAQQAGLQASVDPIGNLFLRLPGRDPQAAPVLCGSHLDSQPTGGRFDGAFGVLAGLEALRAIRQAGLTPHRPLEAVAWSNEEGARFQPGCMGSAVFTGQANLEDYLPLQDAAGERVERALAAMLRQLDEIPRRATGGPVAAYVEAHIEQGPVLEAAGLPIGVVTGIQGHWNFRVTVRGQAAHAGTAPLRARRDALKAAASMVLALEQHFADAQDIVRFTVGRFEVQPGAPNTVPERVLFSIDFRHPRQSELARLGSGVEAVCRAQARGCQVQIRTTSRRAPTAFDPEVIREIQALATRLGQPWQPIHSGASHDAELLAERCPSGMIFVPCADGISHNPAERAEPEHLAAGTRLLAAWLAERGQAR